MAATKDPIDFVKADAWHGYFKREGLDEFKLIENTIAVAAWYRPGEFLERRARLTEFLYAKIKPLPTQLPPPTGKEEKTTTISTKEPSRTKGSTVFRNPDEGKHSTEADQNSITIDINSISTHVSSSPPPPPVRLPKTTNNVPSSSSRRHGKGKGFYLSADGKHWTADYDWMIPAEYRTSTAKVVDDDIAITKDDDDDEDEDELAASVTKLEQQRRQRLQGQDDVSTVPRACNKLKDKRLINDVGTSATANSSKRKVQDNGSNQVVAAKSIVPVCKRNENLGDASMEMKLAASKRKLHEGYTQALHDRKRIKTLDFKDLPQRHSMVKNHTRKQQHMLMI